MTPELREQLSKEVSYTDKADETEKSASTNLAFATDSLSRMGPLAGGGVRGLLGAGANALTEQQPTAPGGSTPGPSRFSSAVSSGLSWLGTLGGRAVQNHLNSQPTTKPTDKAQ